VKRALTIAGSDSGGGAGIQADLKTFTALGVYGLSVLTAITAQNTRGVTGVAEVGLDLIGSQIDAVLSDIGADAAKTGMLASVPVIELVAQKVAEYGLDRLVVDPVMVAKGGDPLVTGEAVEALRDLLLPRALVVTPNRFEAERLAGMKLDTRSDLEAAARRIHGLGARYVVLKGGRDAGPAVDLIYDGGDFIELTADRVETTSLHGSGCTFSAAIAAGLATGLDPIAACRRAKSFVTEAIRRAPGLGGGHGPLNHLITVEPFAR
jgi:hydroxymethylpyrimidine/phosphomethylpyrimidine kinase